MHMLPFGSTFLLKWNLRDNAVHLGKDLFYR